jgi:molecular chaperone DnaK (HSP70)
MTSPQNNINGSPSNKDENETNNGIWIGIDLGTSNCACAVWDSTRGGAKPLRLETIASPPFDKDKVGRMVPSVVLLSSTVSLKEEEDGSVVNVSSISPKGAPWAYVGEAALQKLKQENNTQQQQHTPTVIQSVKRVLGKRLDELDSDFVASLPFELLQHQPQHKENGGGDDKDKEVLQVVATTFEGRQVLLSPVQIVAILLQQIRLQAETYLRRFSKKKHFQVPGQPFKIQNVVVGVPALFSSQQKQLVQDACRLAGFTGHVFTLMESTAAAMAYGLQFASSAQAEEHVSGKEQTLLVVDMGGGTTDITIATKSAPSADNENNNMDNKTKEDSSYQVLVTEGDSRLGGDDMDQALVQFVVDKLKENGGGSTNYLLRQKCRMAKEALCDPNNPSCEYHVIHVGDQSLKITQQDLQVILAPWIDRARHLVQTAVERFQQQQQQVATETTKANHKQEITEVVLVGGATRVPAVREMLQQEFPNVELCTSLDPMLSVAQGLAIQAAFLSGKIPKHEMRSALMLDCIPHAIGIHIGGGREGHGASSSSSSFYQVLPRNARLPARASATFRLADKNQAGITIQAVEKVMGEDGRYLDEDHNPYHLEPLGEFTFLLRRLPPAELSRMEHRTVEVGMSLDVDGKFVASIFDVKDPEQVRKKERYQQMNSDGNKDSIGELGYIADLVMGEAGLTWSEYLLLSACLFLFFVYVAVKIAFAEPPDETMKLHIVGL